MPRLIGDIGGTTARFALVDENGLSSEARTLQVADHPGLVEVGGHYAALPTEGGHVSFAPGTARQHARARGTPQRARERYARREASRSVSKTTVYNIH
jgi:glucokinase